MPAQSSQLNDIINRMEYLALLRVGLPTKTWECCLKWASGRTGAVSESAGSSQPK